MSDIHLDSSTRWQELRRHGRLWRACLNIGLAREAQFRVNLISTVAIGLANVAVSLVPVLLLFSFTDSIDGWSRADMIVILGVFFMMYGLVRVLIARNMYEISQAIQRGTLDVVLIRPVNAQFYLSTRWIRPEKMFDVLTGLLFVIVGLMRGDGWPGVIETVQFVLLLAAGFILITCAWSYLAFSAFWMQSVNAMMLFFQELIEVGRYPIGFFPATIRLVFTALIPMAFVTTFPAQAITHGVSWWLVLVAIAFALLALEGTRRFWLFAVRRYSGASS